MKSSAWKDHIDARVLSMVFILVGLWVLFRVQVGEFYFSGESIAKLLRDMSTWTILGAGMTLVIVAGHIDLSVGSLLAVAAATGAFAINAEYGFGLSTVEGVAIAVAAGTLLGFVQGLLTAYIRIPAFIVTLGGLFIFRGFTQKISAFDPRVPDSSWILSLGFEYLSPNLGWALGAIVCVVFIALQMRRRAARIKAGLSTEPLWLTGTKGAVVSILILGFVWKVNEYRGIPEQTLMMFAVLLIMHIVAHNTTFGRRLYAIGGNVEAARLSGIRVERYTVGIFVLMGFLASVAGIVWMAQNQGSTKNAGEFYELYAIAAVVIGGTSLAGGKGTIFGTFLGGLVMATVIQGMDYSNLDNWLQLVVRGAVLVIAVGIDSLGKNPPRWLQRIRFNKSEN